MTTPHVNNMAISMVKYDAMCTAIEAARQVDEVKDIRDKALAIQMYAKQAKNLDAERHAAEIRVRAERKCGELLAAMPKAVPRGSNQFQAKEQVSNTATHPLSDLGITRDQSSTWQKLASVPESTFEEAIAQQEIPTTSGVLNHRAQGTGQNEWYTPAEYIQAVRDVLGTIDLDPASSDVANKVVGATQFFTAEDDGLTKDWTAKTLWMNPPYAQPLIAQFVEKVVLSFSEGRVLEAIVLTHNYTDTAWFHRAEESCNAVCFTRGRISFLSPEGEKAAPTQGQAFFYFGENVDRFANRFQSIGFVVVPYVF